MIKYWLNKICTILFIYYFIFLILRVSLLLAEGQKKQLKFFCFHIEQRQ